jgi:hypothetical protein
MAFSNNGPRRAISTIVDHPGQVQASDCSAPASRLGFSGELILLSVADALIAAADASNVLK